MVRESRSSGFPLPAAASRFPLPASRFRSPCQGVFTETEGDSDSHMKDYRNLDVWKLAHETVLAVYRATESFPSVERYGLASQIRSSAASIAANIAEGCGRDTDQDFARFAVIAASSANETEYHTILARDLAYIDEPTYDRLCGLIGRVRAMLTALIRTLRM